jgi:hypothetical protein
MKDKDINEEVVKLLKWAPILLTSIKPVQESRSEYTVTIKVSGYIDLMAIAADLIKLCTLASSMDAPHISPLVRNGSIDIPNILELALQLIPSNEMELLENMMELLEKEKLAGTSKKSKKSKISKQTQAK